MGKRLQEAVELGAPPSAKSANRVHWLTSAVQCAGTTRPAHHLGTARMASDPSRGVVNANLQAFDIDKLLRDGSVFRTSGSANPSLTITAVALRLSDHLLTKPASTSSA